MPGPELGLDERLHLCVGGNTEVRASAGGQTRATAGQTFNHLTVTDNLPGLTGLSWTLRTQINVTNESVCGGLNVEKTKPDVFRCSPEEVRVQSRPVFLSADLGAFSCFGSSSCWRIDDLSSLH